MFLSHTVNSYLSLNPRLGLPQGPVLGLPKDSARSGVSLQDLFGDERGPTKRNQNRDPTGNRCKPLSPTCILGFAELSIPRMFLSLFGGSSSPSSTLRLRVHKCCGFLGFCIEGFGSGALVSMVFENRFRFLARSYVRLCRSGLHSPRSTAAPTLFIQIPQ